MATKERYIAEIQDLIDDLASLNATGVLRIRQEFTELLDDIIAGLPRNVRLDSATLDAMLTSLAARLDEYAISYGINFADTVGAQSELTTRIFDVLGRTYTAVGGTASILSTSPELLDIASRMSLGLITGMTSEMLADLRRTLRLAALGPGARVIDASAEINRIMTGNRRWSSRAERIFRTETLRMYSIETQLRMDAFAKLVPLDKRWLWSGISRPEHAAISGQQRRHDGLFDVPLREGGVIQMRYPRDAMAAGRPSAVINCGCYVIPIISGEPSGSVAT